MSIIVKFSQYEENYIFITCVDWTSDRKIRYIDALPQGHAQYNTISQLRKYTHRTFFIFKMKIYQTEKNSNIKFTTIYVNQFSFRITFDWSGSNTQIYIYTRHTHPFTCSLCSLWNIHVEFIAVVSNDYDFFGQENIQFTFPLRYFKLIL